MILLYERQKPSRKFLSANAFWKWSCLNEEEKKKKRLVVRSGCTSTKNGDKDQNIHIETVYIYVFTMFDA